MSEEKRSKFPEKTPQQYLLEEEELSSLDPQPVIIATVPSIEIAARHANIFFNVIIRSPFHLKKLCFHVALYARSKNQSKATVYSIQHTTLDASAIETPASFVPPAFHWMVHIIAFCPIFVNSISKKSAFFITAVEAFLYFYHFCLNAVQLDISYHFWNQ